MKVLAIETSCDETAVAILERNDGPLTVLASVVSSSIEHHIQFGGVVPNLAAREHTKNIVPVIEETLAKSGLTPADIDLLSVTQGPGLMPALLVGVTAAKTLALLWQKPLLGIHHIEGHIYANLLSEDKEQASENKALKFPLVALVASGGHTQLVLMRGHFQYEILGETQDDAAGEAFDKVARMLGLPYPGGPIVAKKADTFSARGGPASCWQIKFPRPMIDSGDYNFSFSGLKTAVLYFLKKNETQKDNEEFISEVCSEFQEAVIDVLVAKTQMALVAYQPATFIIAGGVSANVSLRERLQKLLTENFPATRFLTPPFRYSLDNAAMIGAAALLRYEYLQPEQKAELCVDSSSLEPNANLSLHSF